MASELLDLVERVEKAHFRTHQDTGANPNALLVWNIVREAAGLPKLTQRDLMQRALEDYERNAGRALAAGNPDRAEQYASAVNAVREEIEAYDASHSKTIVRETRCFS